MRYAPPLPAVLSMLIGLAAAGPVLAQAPSTRPADGKILVLPFTPLNPEQSRAWLGRSIQQSLLADLTVAAPGRLLSSDAEAPDMASAADLGRKAGVSFVVQGSFITLPTSAGEGLRMMGEVVEVDGAHAVAAFKVTGLYSEIFRLEDQVANQIRSRLATVSVLPGPAPPVAPVVNAAPQPDPETPLPQVNEYYQAYAMPQPYVDPQAYYNYYLANPYAGGYGNSLGLGLGTGFFFGSYYGHGSNFGGFNQARFGVHDHNHMGGHGGAHAGAATHGGHR